MRKLDAEWIEWAKAHGYSLPARDETDHSGADLVEREEVGFEKISAPDDTQAILPSISDADSFINRIRSIIGQPERNMEDAVKDLLVRLGHPPNRIVFQRGRVDLILQDNSGNLGCGPSFAGTPTGTGGIFGVDVACGQAWAISTTRQKRPKALPTSMSPSRNIAVLQEGHQP